MKTIIILSLIFGSLAFIALVVILFCKIKTPGNEHETPGNEHEPPVYPEPPVSEPTPYPFGSPKNAFLKNLNHMDKLFNALDSNSRIPSEVNDIIIGINNQQLTEIWKRVNTNPIALRRILSQWGIKAEGIKSFKALAFHRERYELEDGSNMKIGKTHTVLIDCWVYTFKNKNGNNVQQIIKKGKCIPEI